MKILIILLLAILPPLAQAFVEEGDTSFCKGDPTCIADTEQAANRPIVQASFGAPQANGPHGSDSAKYCDCNLAPGSVGIDNMGKKKAADYGDKPPTVTN